MNFMINKKSTEKTDKILFIFESVFLVEYLLYVCFSYNNLLFGKPIMSIFVMISFVLGVVILLTRAFRYKNYLENKGIWFLILFCVSYIVTLILNYRYGYMQGIKTFIWMTFNFFIVYFTSKNESQENKHKKVSFVFVTYILYTFVSGIISFIQFCINYSEIIKVTDDYVIPRGLTWGRLWGVYTDPNQGSIMAGISILLTVFYFFAIKEKNIGNKLKKTIYILGTINIIFQVLYISFSDSRTGILAFAIAGSFCLYMILRNVDFKKFNKIAKVFSCIIISIVFFAILVYLPKGIKFTNNLIRTNINSKPTHTIVNDKEDKKGIIGRDSDIEDDISNRRFEIWKSGLEILRTKPIQGVSHDNLVPYALENMPNTYLVNNTQGKFYTFHNAYIDVLVSQGVLGFVIMISMIIYFAICAFKSLKDKEGNEYNSKVIILSISGLIVCSCFFITEIFYVNSPIGYIFWFILGLLLDSSTKNKNDSIKETKNG